MQFQACAYCEHPNPLGTNYCNDCGAALHVKPCRQCGAVAVAKASHCPVCRTEFPVRPTITVDIPWAVSSRPAVGGRSSDADHEGAEPSLSAHSATERLTAATEALTQTRNLIEKASLRAPPLSLQEAPRPRRPAGPAGMPQAAALPRLHATAMPQLLPGDRGNTWHGPEPEDVIAGGAPGARPLFVATLLGLIATVALVFLIRYAGEDAASVNHQVTSPYKLLRSAGTTPPVEPVISVPAAPVPAAPVPAVPVPAVPSTAASSPAPATTAATVAPTVSVPAVPAPASSDPAVAVPSVSVPAISVPAASPAPTLLTVPASPAALSGAARPGGPAAAWDTAATATPAEAARGSAPIATPPPAATSTPAVPSTPSVPSPPAATSRPDSAPTPRGNSTPAVAPGPVLAAEAAPAPPAAAPIAPSGKSGDGAAAPSDRDRGAGVPLTPASAAAPLQQATGKPVENRAAQTSGDDGRTPGESSRAAPSAPPDASPGAATGDCGPELRALNLCGKVSRPL